MLKTKKYAINIALTLATIIILIVLLEIILHIALPPAYQATSKYGWDNEANLTWIREVEDSPGYKINVTVNYTNRGFKRWGDVNTNKTKMLIIGDSFTEMTVVSNGKEWYAYLEKKFPNVEFFVKGVYGYGSLQEYMILNDTIDEIKPDIVLWQFYENDYNDNVYEVDRKWYPWNNHAVRPYLEDEKIVYKLPLPFPELREYSRIADYCLREHDKIIQDNVFKNLTWSRAKYHKNITKEDYAQEFNITLQIMLMVKERANDIPIFLFDSFPMQENLKKKCLSTNITCIENVSEYVYERGKSENLTIIIPNDIHWNMAGNRFAGEYLIDYFKNNTEFRSIIESHE